MRSSPHPIYRLLHKDYPESLNAYSPRTADFYDVLHSQLPHGWKLQRHNMWFYCSRPAPAPPLQGWKIHVSAGIRNSRQILKKVTAVLFKYQDVSFKFAADGILLSLINSKGWPRGSSGKFITIYPPDSHRFLSLIEEINQATEGMQGPYILSDHRYKTSRVVFYRYGGIRPHTTLNIKGEKVPVLTAPDGNLVPDQRLAYPILPAWETPPFPIESCSSEGEGRKLSLLHGRYTVENAIAFSSAGGVYIAHDNQTGKKVVVKEARPGINAIADDCDAVELLKKEFRLLTVVADTGIAPQPIALFQEWEHWFLVEEFIEGLPLSRHSAVNSILLRTRATPQDYKQWCALFSKLAAALLRIVRTLHSRKVVFADLSTNNLILTTNGEELKIIDFEGAHQPEFDRPVNMFTPGFISQDRVARGHASQEDDYYSAGAVLLAYLLPINGLLHLKPEARREFIASLKNDAHLSESAANLINDLMDRTESAPALGHGIDVSGAFEVTGAHDAARQGRSVCYQMLVESIARHLNGVADYANKDLLYPTDPRVFSTNPLSLAYGAAGIVYALYKITGTVPEKAVDWILQRQITPAEYPPGLYHGMSGIAWALLEIGMRSPAEKIFRLTFKHPLLHKSADLFHGTAGWGMTALRFFQATGNEIYMRQAEAAGQQLLRSLTRSESGYFSATSKDRPLGLGHGGSGIGLFLLYLSLATGKQDFLQAGIRALDFDVAAGTQTRDGGISWRESFDSAPTLYPYWRFGSAGIGVVTARFHRVTGEARYQSILEQIYIDTDRKYAVFPGRFLGLAGMGEFLLDMYAFTGEKRFLESANKVASGIMHFRVERNGTAFPGELLSRLCCDYGTGSAGIALFFNRLLGNQQSDFMLDELLEGSKREMPGGPSGFTQLRAIAFAA